MEIQGYRRTAVLCCCKIKFFLKCINQFMSILCFFSVHLKSKIVMFNFKETSAWQNVFVPDINNNSQFNCKRILEWIIISVPPKKKHQLAPHASLTTISSIFPTVFSTINAKTIPNYLSMLFIDELSTIWISGIYRPTIWELQVVF